MAELNCDLLIRAGRIFCAENAIDGPGAVGVKGDRIVAAGTDVGGTAQQTFEFDDALLLPGLVDLHAHPARDGSKYGIDPDEHFLPRGVTTVMSQGDAGANNWADYRRDVIEASTIRVLMALNLAAPGETKTAGCFEDLDDVDVDACVRTIEESGDSIWGIAANCSVPCCGGTDPDEILARAIEAADRTGLPILFGTRRDPDRSLAAELARLRSGDVVTYCFHPESDTLVKDGRIRDEVWEARGRGVLFDIGHGMGSFSFEVAEAAIADGFCPDTISTDQYKRHVGSVPQHDLPRTMSKLIAVGLPETEAFARITVRPANVLGLASEVGTLSPDSCADLTVLKWDEDALPLVDINGVERPGGCWESVLTVRAGKVVSSS